MRRGVASRSRHRGLVSLVATVLVLAAEWPHVLRAAEGHPLDARALGLLINDADPLSVEVGNYYRARRRIPAENVVHVRLSVGPSLTPEEFARVKAVVDARTPMHVQAYALAWIEPYRVGCMSVTSAFAYGFDQRFCVAGCRHTPMSPYFNSDSHRPFGAFHMRPAMMLAATDFTHAKALIDRGVEADASSPFGTAYLLDTSDRARDIRAASFAYVSLLEDARIRVEILKSDVLHDRSDVLFYFTGVARVAGLDTIHFLPGAIADHLTSFGGMLVGSPQMSSLEWLEAGATGSYGTVVEPCAIRQKFPEIPIVIRRYLGGDTLIEAYWKSVAEPSQGVFIGEPLARPFGPSTDALHVAHASVGGARP